jgi:hypothetical protein
MARVAVDRGLIGRSQSPDEPPTQKGLCDLPRVYLQLLRYGTLTVFRLPKVAQRRTRCYVRIKWK